MKLSPVEIQNMVFPKKTIGGVDESTVRDFLIRTARDYEELQKDNRRLNEELDLIKKDVNNRASLESTLKDALVSAEKTTGMIKKNAEKESLILLRESELKAEKMLDDARLELKTLTDEIRNYKNLKRKLKSEMKVLLQTYSDMLEAEDK